MACLTFSRLPDSFITLMTESIRNPTGIWADYNCEHRHRENLNEMSKGGAYKSLCPADVPATPNVSDYPDLDEDRTIDCC